MIITAPEISRTETHCKYKVNVLMQSGPKELWFRVQNDFAELISHNSDAAVIALLIPAMLSNEEIKVEGAVSERLLLNLSGPLQKILQLIIPSLNVIHIHAAETNSVSNPAKGVATGFSGGIDSFCTLDDFKYNKKSDRSQITHLLFNNFGSHGKTNAQKIFDKRYIALLDTTQKIGLPFVKIDSNLADFYDKKINFKQTHTIRNAVAPFLLQKGIGTFYYSSGLSYETTFIGKKSDTAYSDLVTLPMLSTESLHLTSVGGEYSRVEKTLKVSHIPDSYETLDVCARGRNEINCSACKKCMRTLLTLELAGKLKQYAAVFDLDIFQKERARYISKAQQGGDPLFEEIVSFAHKNGNQTLTAPTYYKLLYWLKKRIKAIK
ncbi:hypothetical protein [Desulfuromonas acetoxidans]|uniref:hypothetical protein n=1 Tax=Desulfuromonas acetoxidans TaxID=891 RepID=UPI00292D861B|nr:hypothetical protein [Desulfuromonas acetoxidans]